MSDSRLVGRLSKAGVYEDEIESMDRTALLNRWAEIVATGGEAGPVKVEAAAAVKVGYDIEWEKQKLQLQAKQWEEELAERRAQREAEKQAARETEAKRLEAEVRRLEAEKAERQAAREAEVKRLEAEVAERKAARDLETLRMAAEARRWEQETAVRILL